MNESRWRGTETRGAKASARQYDRRMISPDYDIEQRLRTEEPSLEDQLADFVDGHIPGSTRIRRRSLRTEEINLSIKRTKYPLGKEFGHVGDTSLRKYVDCLDIDDFEIYRSPDDNPLEPLEDFIQIAFRDFPGEALNFQNVTDPELARWCESHGWTKREKMGHDEPDYHLLLPPFALRQESRIITTSWTTKEIYSKDVPELPPAEPTSGDE